MSDLDWYSPVLRTARDMEYAILMRTEFTFHEVARLLPHVSAERIVAARDVMLRAKAIKRVVSDSDETPTYRRLATRFANMTVVCQPRNQEGDFVDLAWRAAEYMLLNAWRMPLRFLEDDIKAPVNVELRNKALSHLVSAGMLVQDANWMYKFSHFGSNT